MILLYLIFVPILILIIWLVVHKNWKALLWTVGFFIVLVVVGQYLTLRFVSTAFQDKCETLKIWEIEGYEVIEKSCTGFAGPPWNPIYLYKKNIEIDYVNYKTDSCLVKFTNKIGDTLIFDLCTEKMKEMKKEETGANNI